MEEALTRLLAGTYSIAFVGTCLSWLAITHSGRRTIYIAGLACMVPFMFIIGFVDLAPASDTIRWTQSGLLLVWFFIYGKQLLHRLLRKSITNQTVYKASQSAQYPTP